MAGTSPLSPCSMRAEAPAFVPTDIASAIGHVEELVGASPASVAAGSGPIGRSGIATTGQPPLWDASVLRGVATYPPTAPYPTSIGPVSPQHHQQMTAVSAVLATPPPKGTSSWQGLSTPSPQGPAYGASVYSEASGVTPGSPPTVLSGGVGIPQHAAGSSPVPGGYGNFLTGGLGAPGGAVPANVAELWGVPSNHAVGVLGSAGRALPHSLLLGGGALAQRMPQGQQMGVPWLSSDAQGTFIENEFTAMRRRLLHYRLTMQGSARPKGLKLRSGSVDANGVPTPPSPEQGATASGAGQFLLSLVKGEDSSHDPVKSQQGKELLRMVQGGGDVGNSTEEEHGEGQWWNKMQGALAKPKNEGGKTRDAWWKQQTNGGQAWDARREGPTWTAEKMTTGLEAQAATHRRAVAGKTEGHAGGRWAPKQPALEHPSRGDIKKAATAARQMYKAEKDTRAHA